MRRCGVLLRGLAAAYVTLGLELIQEMRAELGEEGTLDLLAITYHFRDRPARESASGLDVAIATSADAGGLPASATARKTAER